MAWICITPSVSIKAVSNDDMLVLKALTKETKQNKKINKVGVFFKVEARRSC